MVLKSASLAIGLPHSGHSGGVNGKESSSMVLSTSTNGTSATMPLNNSPARLATAPISMPPALPPWPTMRFAPVYLASINARADAAKSSKVLVFLSRLPSRYQPHQMVGVKFDIDDIDALAVRDQVAPLGALRRCKRRGDDLEVDDTIGVGENEQLAAAIGNRILHADFAGRDQARWRVGIGEVDQPLLGGFMVAAGNHAKSAGRAFMDMGEPAGIALFINQNI